MFGPYQHWPPVFRVQPVPLLERQRDHTPTLTYVQKCMQWRKWRKIASCWRFELDAKSGPLEAGDFGENGDFGKNRQRAGDMWQNIQIGCKSGPFKVDN